ncbi:LMWPc-domain-containing protein [Xylariaceae sp. FL0016]|nr:LMWPc-domain-containing protein [Xylariaceae sp. FL0016]
MTQSGAEAGSEGQISVLFVCLGNICRSTMAEGVFKSIAKDPASPYSDHILKVDSCGTGGYHTGDEPDSRTLETLAKHGITNYTHAARQLRTCDFDDFDYILAMDTDNLNNVRRWEKRSKSGTTKAQVLLFGEFSGTGRKEAIQDPYYSGDSSFEMAYEQCRRFSENFLAAKLPQVPRPT